MKHSLFRHTLLLLALMVAVAVGAKDRTIRVLAIGNSFSEDAVVAHGLL